MPFTSLVLSNDAETLAVLTAAMDSVQVKRELCSSSAHAKKLLAARKFDAIADQVMEELKRRGVLAQAIGAKPQFHYSI